MMARYSNMPTAKSHTSANQRPLMRQVRRRRLRFVAGSALTLTAVIVFDRIALQSPAAFLIHQQLAPALSAADDSRTARTRLRRNVFFVSENFSD